MGKSLLQFFRFDTNFLNNSLKSNSAWGHACNAASAHLDDISWIFERPSQNRAYDKEQLRHGLVSETSGRMYRPPEHKNEAQHEGIDLVDVRMIEHIFEVIEVEEVFGACTTGNVLMGHG